MAASAIFINLCYHFSFLSLLRWKPTGNETTVPASVIVCAKNEEENLKSVIPALLKQDYPEFELVVINDGSNDGTLAVINHFQDLDERVTLVDVVPNESFWGNKKYALTLGIKKAKHKRLLFIDADCIPASDQWIARMLSSGKQHEVTLGYGGYHKESGLLNSIIRFETVITAIQYFNYALNGMPYMGVGRNLSYNSDLFYSVRGFQDHLHVMGGDDDLFINQVANKKNTSVELSPESFTYSKPKTKWKAWWGQKRRHINTAKHYKTKHKLLLGLFHLTQAVVILSFGLLFIESSFKIYFIAFLAFRYISTWIILGLNFSKLKEGGLIFWIPFLELFLLTSHLGLLLNSILSPPKRWN